MQGHESLSADALPEESCSIAISTNTNANANKKAYTNANANTNTNTNTVEVKVKDGASNITARFTGELEMLNIANTNTNT